MAKKAVIGIVKYKGKILIGKKRKDSHKFLAGEWHIPGESVEGDETDEEALIRGFRQETGIEIIVEKYLTFNLIPSSKSKANWYECLALTSDVKPGSDLEDAMWVSREYVLDIFNERVYSRWPEKILNYFT